MEKSEAETISILLVEDDACFQILLQATWRKFIRPKHPSWKMQMAGDGQKALKIMQTSPEINVVITDLLMPGMDGLSLMQAIHNQYGESKTIVVMSACDTMESIRKAMNNGAFDFLPKPFCSNDFLTTLENAAAHQLKSENLTYYLQKALDSIKRTDRTVSAIKKKTERFQVDLAQIYPEALTAKENNA